MLQCVRHRFPGVKIRCSGQDFDYLLQNIFANVLFVSTFHLFMQIHNICNGVLSELKTTESEGYVHLSGL